jgi:aspartyl-tRNA(Asn)/glutamyl-tRNA(Gln) amidotransferase subunit A
MKTEELLALDIPAARAGMAAGELTATDLVEACLRRIAETEPVVHAWNHVDAGGARAAAAQIDASDIRPLAGIPVGIKDIIDVAGMPTTASSRVLRGNVAGRDAPVVALLRQAGAVVIGKTNTHEFAYGYVTSPTTNPWDEGRIPGGSSGGSAAAVAVSDCLGALGSDTGGSIRVPAALCGVTGLKPRQGVLPMEGIVALSPSLDVVGPIARTVASLAEMWRALTGRGPAPSSEGARLASPIPESLPEMQPGVAAAYERALDALAGLGSLRRDIKVPKFEDFDMPRSAILLPEALEVHRKQGWWPGHSDEYTEETRRYLEFAENFFMPEMAEAGRVQAKRLAAELDAVFDDADVLAIPGSPIEAPTHEWAAGGDDPTEIRREVAMVLGRLPGAINVAGLAALAVPCGFTESGLPVGIQLVGRNEELLLRVALDFEKATGWTARWPSL